MKALDAIPHHRHTEIMKTKQHCKSLYYIILWLRESLKFVFAIFHFFIKSFFFFFFLPLNNYEKCFSFHLKSSFRSWNIQICVLSSLFFTVSHWLRGWSKKNLKVYDVSNCLNENLITHFVWYLEMEKKIWHWNFANW